MNFRRNTKQRIPDINLTPLVDVVLLLVLFFMVTAQFSVLPGLKLSLPGVDQSSKVRVQPEERLEITLTAAGDLYFEDQPTTLKNLPLHLERTGASGSDAVIVVTADRSVSYGQIIKIMDTLRIEGFNRVVFAASPEKPGEEKESFK
ncbi:biopolymer transporter ExbD [Deltaproteobacteria bacterium OttesenSCG-928-K17]|nr:biopolymer transporter ExbD [Deltaproteobacteria bacterium OttesenSCG-928-K17]